MAGLLWISLPLLVWRSRVARSLWFLVTIASAGFLSCPVRNAGEQRRADRSEALRADTVKAMRRYLGAPYYWGGESPLGIDCSGLIRRGLIEALIWDGMRWLQPALVREGIWVWWNDTTARGLVAGAGDRTRFVAAVESLNALDDTTIHVGDLAVTASGLHVLAYAGEHEWIEADPAEWRVVTMRTPGPPDGWLGTPMKVVRWRVLE